MSRTKNLAAQSRERRPPVRVRLAGIQGNVPTFGSPSTSDEAWRKHLKAAFGTASDAFVEVSLRQLQFAARIPGDGPSELAINAAIAMIAAVKPANEIEAALAVQMACAHMVAMVMFARIGGGHGGPHRLPGLGATAAKLLRAYSTQIETLRRLRAGGEQKIIVKHVTVNEGGQAIVGAVNSRLREQ